MPKDNKKCEPDPVFSRFKGGYWGVSGCGGTSGEVCNATTHKIVSRVEMVLR